MSGTRILKPDQFVQAVSDAAVLLAEIAEKTREVEFPYIAVAEGASLELLASFYTALLRDDKQAVRTLFLKNPPPQKTAWRITEAIAADGQVTESAAPVAVSHLKVLEKLDIILKQNYSDELSKKYLQRQFIFYRNQEEKLQIDKSTHLDELLKKIEREIKYLEPFSCGHATEVLNRLAAIFSKKPNLTEALAQDLVLAIFVGRDIAKNSETILALATVLHPTISVALTHIATSYSAFLSQAAPALDESKREAKVQPEVKEEQAAKAEAQPAAKKEPTAEAEVQPEAKEEQTDKAKKSDEIEAIAEKANTCKARFWKTIQSLRPCPKRTDPANGSTYSPTRKLS